MVPQGHCWIEGDNHSASYDSNKFGCIPMGLILGKAKILKSAAEYQWDIVKFAQDTVNSFSLIKTDMPDRRELVKLKQPDQRLLKILIQNNRRNSGSYYYVDYHKRNKPEETRVNADGDVLPDEILKELQKDLDDIDDVLTLHNDDDDDGY